MFKFFSFTIGETLIFNSSMVNFSKKKKKRKKKDILITEQPDVHHSFEMGTVYLKYNSQWLFCFVLVCFVVVVFFCCHMPCSITV